MPKAHPLFLELAGTLRELARDPGAVWSYWTHAEDEMIDAGLDYSDAVDVLQNGTIIAGETSGDFWDRRYRVAKRIDGVDAIFVVSFCTEERWIEIITAFNHE